MIAALVTGASCNDPNGDCPKANFLKRFSSESGQGSRVGWPLATSEVHGTQMAQIAWNDHWRLLYRSEVIVIAEVMTGATCNDPTGEHPEDNFLMRSSLESGQGLRVGWLVTTSKAYIILVPRLRCHDH